MTAATDSDYSHVAAVIYIDALYRLSTRLNGEGIHSDLLDHGEQAIAAGG